MRIAKTSTTEEFVEKAKIVHKNFYDYSQVNYINAIEKVLIMCPKHGLFLQDPSIHLRGSGCKKCSKNCYSKKALKWLSHFDDYLDIRTAENINGEHKIKLLEPSIYWKNHIKINGYCQEYNLCLEFDGCLFHGCDQCSCKNIVENPITGFSMVYHRQKTKAKHELIKSMGYNLIIIRECDYEVLKKNNQLDEYAEDLYFNHIMNFST